MRFNKMKMTNCKVSIFGSIFLMTMAFAASSERHERSVAIDPETLSELEDIEDEMEMEKRAPQLSINQDLHTLAASLKGKSDGNAFLQRWDFYNCCLDFCNMFWVKCNVANSTQFTVVDIWCDYSFPCAVLKNMFLSLWLPDLIPSIPIDK